ncbi:hypothetical protein [Dysgonomonas sp. GY617]|uniref:hypothetical protein n=1 Tax=Dysgonomonas sp. GY617 TaxID=2780420 RepID=UPI00188329F5|nr:hypothetical protein [Dysgonomonas sp. GY617]MBF0575997.1 hypothetical protein [Dysgonomonas sp. GY617]
MKLNTNKLLLSIVGFLFFIEGYSQVGINTINPLFDLDIRGDMFISGKSKMGGSATDAMNPSIQLELSDTDKGLLLNRVSLTNLLQKSPVAGAVDGTLVYNTVQDAPNQLYPGVYVWRNNAWRRLVDEIPPKHISLYYASSSVIGGLASGGDQSSMVSMSFTSTRGGAAESLVLPESGSYAFNVKLYTTYCNAAGNSIVPSNAGKVVVYVGIWINNVLNDVSEIFYQVSPLANGSTGLNGSNLTNVILGCSGNAGDQIDIRLGFLQSSVSSGEYIRSQYQSSVNPTSNATSMLFWKL